MIHLQTFSDISLPYEKEEGELSSSEESSVELSPKKIKPRLKFESDEDDDESQEDEEKSDEEVEEKSDEEKESENVAVGPKTKGGRRSKKLNSGKIENGYVIYFILNVC